MPLAKLLAIDFLLKQQMSYDFSGNTTSTVKALPIKKIAKQRIKRLL